MPWRPRMRRLAARGQSVSSHACTALSSLRRSTNLPTVAMLRCGSAHEAGHIYSVAHPATAEIPMAKANKANGAHGFPKEITLPNGAAIALRLMGQGDKDKILAFARAL